MWRYGPPAAGEGHRAAFGVQPVQRITFAPHGARSNHRVVETATPDHRWELKDGTTTTALKVGDVVPAEFVEESFALDLEGYVHGLIFADRVHQLHVQERRLQPHDEAVRGQGG
jgi:hypothetical protein